MRCCIVEPVEEVRENKELLLIKSFDFGWHAVYMILWENCPRKCYSTWFVIKILSFLSGEAIRDAKANDWRACITKEVYCWTKK